MKKLMIAASLVCAAALSQAATVSWGSDAIYKPVDAKGTYGTATGDKVKTTAMGYLWEVDKAAYDLYAADTSKIYAEFAKEGHGALGDATKSAATSSTSKSTLAGTKDWAEDSTAYGLILYTYTDASGNDWYVANAAKYEGIGKTEAAVTALNAFEGGKVENVAQGPAITGWTAAAVPEPTSGLLLLLLGVAGLALRRRRA